MVELISIYYQLETQMLNPWAVQRHFDELYFANKFLTNALHFQIKNGWVLPLVFGSLTVFEILENIR